MLSSTNPCSSRSGRRMCPAGPLLHFSMALFKDVQLFRARANHVGWHA